MSHRRVGTSTGTPQADLNAVQREAECFRLRAAGYDFSAVAQMCGYANASGAYKAYKRALARIPQRAVEEMRETIYAQQLHALVAIGKRIDKGDTYAIREMTLIHERMAKLFGLDTPVADAAIAAAQVVVRAYPPEWVNAINAPVVVETPSTATAAQAATTVESEAVPA